MKIKAFYIILFIACVEHVYSQSRDSLKVVISHIFFCVDSVTYNNLLEHEFIAKNFANTREITNTTSIGTYTAKYLMGQKSYIEVFKPVNKQDQSELGDKFGDLGMVFRTRKPGDINKLEQRIKTDNKQVTFKVIDYEDSGKTIPFNQYLYLSHAGLQETFRPYAEEFTIEFLKICGFNETEIRSGVTEEQFREKRRGKKYEKLYDNIEKVELILTKVEFEHLAETLKYFNFSRNGERFTSNGLEIYCSIRENRSYKLKAIHFKLVNRTDDIIIEISKNLTFRVSGIHASFEFNYQEGL